MEWQISALVGAELLVSTGRLTLSLFLLEKWFDTSNSKNPIQIKLKLSQTWDLEVIHLFTHSIVIDSTGIGGLCDITNL